MCVPDKGGVGQRRRAASRSRSALPFSITLKLPLVRVKIAKSIQSIDVLSGGRAMCGLGTAWFEREHDLYGWGMQPRADRYARLEVTGGLLQFKQEYNEPGLQEVADAYQQAQYGRTFFSTSPIDQRTGR